MSNKGKSMMSFKILLLAVSIFLYPVLAFTVEYTNDVIKKSNLSITTKKIEIEGFPDALNSSLLKIDQGILLSFRYWPEYFISYIGVVLLNDNFEPITKPQLLFMDSNFSHFEDARLFSYNGKIFIAYGDYSYTLKKGAVDLDNANSIISGTLKETMAIGELKMQGNEFALVNPVKLLYQDRLRQDRQKNWVPFEWNGIMLFSYYPSPHIVLKADLVSGRCKKVADSNPQMYWPWGEIRGGTPACLVDGEYLAFFHSSTILKGLTLKDDQVIQEDKTLYFMGAYTFSAQPPFSLTKTSPSPIVADGMYSPNVDNKHVIFPGGYIIEGDSIYISYGKDDCEIWVAKLSKRQLMDSLVPVSSSP